MRLRPFEVGDYPRRAELMDVAFPGWGFGERTLRELDASLRADPDAYQSVCVAEESGEVVGFGGLMHNATLPPHHLRILVVVDEAWRRRGLGRELLERLEEEALGVGAAVLDGDVHEADDASLAWAAHHGYRLWRTRPRSVRDLGQPFPEEAPPRVEGLTITTLAEAGSAVHRSLYELFASTSKDMPLSEAGATYPSFEAWHRSLIESPLYRAEAIWLALVGARVVGCTTLFFPAGAGELWVGYTGVAREHRRRGLSYALKLESMRWARARGYPRLLTANDADNPAILTVNRRLGFRSEPGRRIVRKTFQG